MKPYRQCVIAAIINDEDRLLAGERSDIPGSWQLPQGGIDPGESPEQALFRELSEEIGCSDLEIIRRLDEPIRYDFPSNLRSEVAKSYAGQEQYWFLLKLNVSAKPDLEAADGEFSQLTWMPVDHLVSGVVFWKQEAYRQGLSRLLHKEG